MRCLFASSKSKVSFAGTNTGGVLGGGGIILGMRLSPVAFASTAFAGRAFFLALVVVPWAAGVATAFLFVTRALVAGSFATDLFAGAA